MLGTSDDLNTITSELFGHERGSFSGAVGKRIGLVEYAHKGTLVLDEVLNLPPQAQKLLLDFTQFGKNRPLRYDKPEPKSAQNRLLAATNGDLDLAMKTGRFREDLYHRLAAIVLDLPPLRERREDIPALAERALLTADPGRTWSLSVPLRRMLLSSELPWAGNIRQLERVILRARERALHRNPDSLLLEPDHVEPRDLDRKSHDLSGTAPSQPSPPGSSQPMSTRWEKLQSDHERVEAEQAQLLREALVQANGVVAHAARELGIARTTLASRIESLGIRPNRRGDA
jgi:transcriptional regulator with GAF, ATPase, and Fis domain